MPCRGVFEPDFGLKWNKVDEESDVDAATPLFTESIEPEVSSNAAPPRAPAAAAATTAKTGRAGEINCPVIICGI